MNKWMIWGAHPYFWKHPYIYISNLLTHTHITCDMSEGIHRYHRLIYCICSRKGACLDISEVAKVYKHFTPLSLHMPPLTLEKGHLLQTVTMRRAYCAAIFATGRFMVAKQLTTCKHVEFAELINVKQKIGISKKKHIPRAILKFIKHYTLET